MAFNYSPKIVTDGLVLALDAANNKSYPGSGTTWTDISRGGNNGTLYNGPTFSNTNGGNIVFDGSNNFVGFSNSSLLQLNLGTVCVWVKTSSPGSGFRGIVTKQNNYSLFTNSGILVTYDWGNSAIRSTGVNIADGSWKNICMTFTDNSGSPSNNVIIYINGISVLTTTIKILNNNIGLEICRGGSGPGGPGQILNGSIAQTSIYNRPLTSTEVLQNYNATKTRFGL